MVCAAAQELGWDLFSQSDQLFSADIYMLTSVGEVTDFFFINFIPDLQLTCVVIDYSCFVLHAVSQVS